MSEKLSVSAIENGTVIDHITPLCGLKIVLALKLPDQKKRVTVGLNLASKSLGHKDLIKIEGHTLSEEDASRVALLSPQATINLIEGFAVVKKFPVAFPCFVEKMFDCTNPHCITRFEPLTSGFEVLSKGGKVELKCRYCEKVFAHDAH